MPANEPAAISQHPLVPPSMTAGAPALLAAQALYLRRGGRELFGGLSLELHSGDLVWLRGANGVGKSTLLRILAGLLTPEGGRLRWRGGDWAARKDEPVPAVALLDERLGLTLDLSVVRNLEYAAALAGTPPAAAAMDQEPLAALGLSPLARRPVRALSTGQKKRVALARILLSRAPVWLLDEPANGLDQDNRARLATLMDSHCRAGGICLFASHEALLPAGRPTRTLSLDVA